MSLINRMLQDLDARRADPAERGALHREVRPLPAPATSGGKLRALASAALLIAAGAAGAWWYFQAAPGAGGTPLPPLASPALTVQPVAATSLSPSVATMPVPSAEAAVDIPGGLKLSAALDRLPVEVEVPAAPQQKRRQAAVAEKISPPLLPLKERGSAQAAVEAPSRQVLAAASPRAAPGAIEKTDSAASPRERAEIDYRKAIALANGGRVAEATDLLLDTLRHDGSHSAARQLLVKLLIEQRKAEEAMALLHEGLEMQPGQIAWAMTLARMQVERSNLEAAWKTLQRSLAQGGASADYLGFCGHVLYRLGRQREAVEHYQSAIKQAPGEGRWWVGLGLAQEADNHPAEARDAFLRAKASGSLRADLAAFVDQKLR